MNAAATPGKRVTHAATFSRSAFIAFSFAANRSGLMFSSAVRRPTMVSLLTFMPRPMPCDGVERNLSFGISDSGGFHSG